MKHQFHVKKGYAYLAIIAPMGVYTITSLYGLFGLISGDQVSWYGSLFILGSVLLFDHGVALSHPTSVTLTDTSIQFHAFKRTHEYQFKDITRINVRKLSRGRRLYVRINEASLLKGRYWCHLDHMNDATQLTTFLESLMEERHPKMKHMDRHSFKKVK